MKIKNVGDDQSLDKIDNFLTVSAIMTKDVHREVAFTKKQRLESITGKVQIYDTAIKRTRVKLLELKEQQTILKELLLELENLRKPLRDEQIRLRTHKSTLLPELNANYYTEQVREKYTQGTPQEET